MPPVDLPGSPSTSATETQAAKHANLVRSAVADLAPMSVLCATSAPHHPIQSIRSFHPALDRRRQNEARNIWILTFLLTEASFMSTQDVPTVFIVDDDKDVRE